MSTSVVSILEDIQSGLAYDQEAAKLDFSVQLHDLMDRGGVSQRALADATGKSEAYISKALRGDANLTIETMVALVKGAAGKLHFKVTGDGKSAWFAEVFDGSKAGRNTRPAPAGWSSAFRDHRIGLERIAHAQGGKNVAAA